MMYKMLHMNFSHTLISINMHGVSQIQKLMNYLNVLLFFILFFLGHFIFLVVILMLIVFNFSKHCRNIKEFC